jgi:hypothetical protein
MHSTRGMVIYSFLHLGFLAHGKRNETESCPTDLVYLFVCNHIVFNHVVAMTNVVYLLGQL